jgi:hypothetical protein
MATIMDCWELIIRYHFPNSASVMELLRVGLYFNVRKLLVNFLKTIGTA